MEKRFQSIDSMINISVLVVLSATEKEKLESPNLRPKIDAIAKDMHVDWAIETNSNVYMATISRMYGPIVGKEEEGEMETAAINFMSSLSKLELKKSIPAIDDEKADQAIQDYEFIKKLVEDWEEVVVVKGKDTIKPGIVGFTIMANVANRYAIPCGRVGHDLAKELCMCYLKVHGHDKQG